MLVYPIYIYSILLTFPDFFFTLCLKQITLFLYVILSVYLSFYLSVSIFFSVWLYFRLSVCLTRWQNVYAS